ncbi:hypothetical protein CR513_36170, partial [Mucuna pruriens]
MDTAEPLLLFHQWGHHIPISDRSNRGSTSEAGRMGTPYGTGIDNATPTPDNANESNREEEGEGLEEEALIELERMIERERPRL